MLNLTFRCSNHQSMVLVQGGGTENDETEEKTWKQTRSHIPNKLFTKKNRQFNGREVAFTLDGVGAVGHPSAKNGAST